MGKVYVFLADGFETVEAMAPIDVMRRAGLQVVVVSIMGRLEVVSAQGAWHQEPWRALRPFSQCKHPSTLALGKCGDFPFSGRNKQCSDHMWNSGASQGLLCKVSPRLEAIWKQEQDLRGAKSRRTCPRASEFLVCAHSLNCVQLFVTP